jgi:hypothetical protein
MVTFFHLSDLYYENTLINLLVKPLYHTTLASAKEMFFAPGQFTAASNFRASSKTSCN